MNRKCDLTLKLKNKKIEVVREIEADIKNLLITVIILGLVVVFINVFLSVVF